MPMIFFGMLLSIFAFLGYDLYKNDAEHKEQVRKEEEYKNLPKVIPIPDSIKWSWDGSVYTTTGFAVLIDLYGKYDDMDRRMECAGLRYHLGYDFDECLEDFHLNPEEYLPKVSTLQKGITHSEWLKSL